MCYTNQNYNFCVFQILYIRVTLSVYLVKAGQSLHFIRFLYSQKPFFINLEIKKYLLLSFSQKITPLHLNLHIPSLTHKGDISYIWRLFKKSTHIHRNPNIYAMQVINRIFVLIWILRTNLCLSFMLFFIQHGCKLGAINFTPQQCF